MTETDDATLGGYFDIHERPPAFEGVDGGAYSVALYVDSEPGPGGRYGGALLFVRWNAGGDQPSGHVETEYLVEGRTPAEAEQGLRALTLHDVKHHLDQAIARAQALPEW